VVLIKKLGELMGGYYWKEDYYWSKGRLGKVSKLLNPYLTSLKLGQELLNPY